MSGLAPPGTDPNTLTALLVGGGAFVLVLLTTLWLAFAPREERELARRIERIKSPNARRTVEALRESGGTLRRQTRDSSIAGLDRLFKRALPSGAKLRQQLERSGLGIRAGDYLLASLGLGVAAFAMLWLLLDLPLAADAALALLVAAGIPHVVVGHLSKRRTKRFLALLPEGLDLIVRGIRSGLPATEAMNTIGAEIADPVGAEFRQVMDQVKIGVGLDEAMWSAARRLQIAEFNFLVISLAIQQETGGNLAEILEKLSDMVRRREQMRLKVKAMSSEARASAMIIGSLPFIMGSVITFLNPGYMNGLFGDPRGWVMLGMGFASLGFGLLVMAKMVRFEI